MRHTVTEWKRYLGPWPQRQSIPLTSELHSDELVQTTGSKFVLLIRNIRKVVGSDRNCAHHASGIGLDCTNQQYSAPSPCCLAPCTWFALFVLVLWRTSCLCPSTVCSSFIRTIVTSSMNEYFSRYLSTILHYFVKFSLNCLWLLFVVILSPLWGEQ